MKRKVLKISLVCLILSLVAVIGIGIFAIEGEYTRDITKYGLTVTANGQVITGVYSDPVDYWEVASSGTLNDYEIRYDTVNEVDSVIYTGFYPNTTTGRVGENVVEYVCEKQDKAYVVTKINESGDGTTYIPLNGFVFSVNKTVVSDFANIGDEVAITGEISIPTRAVESTSGKRIVVDATNATRSQPMVVYYDYQFGEKTGTNVFGTEMICEFNFEKNTFIVTGFRPFLSGDDSGSYIPDNGFVLSAYGEGYRALLAAGELFKKDDEVKMVGFDYVRFGGTVHGTFDHINPTKETNPNGMETATDEFPAFRGTDQTIIYKDGWDYKGSAGTGTNVYGFEAAVNANGIVVELGVNVSKIPEGGYVISGHGVGRDFIRSNVVLGATIVLDEVNKTYSISTTLNSYYENLVTNVETVIDVAKSRIKQLYDVNVDVINEYIAKVEAELETLRALKESIEEKLADPDLTEEERLALLMNYNNSQLKIEKLRQSILVSSAESKVVSARAVWHRPIEATYAEIKTNVEMYKKIGINLIFVETLYNGYSSFRSEVEEFPYHKNLAATYTDENGNVYNDYLSAFLACCKENGIEVHAWVENFYVGIDPSVKVLTMHPDWVMYNEDGTTVQRNEGGPYYFIDPANKEVQDTLIAYYNDLLAKNPDIAGLNLDYIRYPVSNEVEDTGFTMAAMKGFYELLGKEFTANQLSDRTKMYNKFKQLFDKNYLLGGQAEADANYKQWVSYRMSVITEYVRRIKNEVKDANGVMLSTSVFASLTESTNSKKQDWRTWFLNGWIDLATPMAYYTDATDVNARVKDMILMAGNNCLYYTGIASSYSGLPAWQNKEHIEASYNAGANGYVIFCSTQIIGHEDVQNALVSGVNSKWAVLPHAAIEEVLTAMFESILDKADRLYIPAGGMTEENKAELEAIFAEILAMPHENAEDIYNIVKALQSLSKTDIKNYAKGYSRQRIIEQLNELADILDARISMQLIADGEWDPETDPMRPSFEKENNNTPVVPNPPVNDNTNDNNNTQEPEELGFFARIIQAIILFFKRLFGLV